MVFVCAIDIFIVCLAKYECNDLDCNYLLICMSIIQQLTVDRLLKCSYYSARSLFGGRNEALQYLNVFNSNHVYWRTCDSLKYGITIFSRNLR